MLVSFYIRKWFFLTFINTGTKKHHVKNQSLLKYRDHKVWYIYRRLITWNDVISEMKTCSYPAIASPRCRKAKVCCYINHQQCCRQTEISSSVQSTVTALLKALGLSLIYLSYTCLIKSFTKLKLCWNQIREKTFFLFIKTYLLP